MKVSLTHYGKTISAEVARDDLDLTQALALVGDVLIGAGFNDESVRDALPQMDFPESDFRDDTKVGGTD